MAEGERPHRGFSDRRGVRLEDAADDNASGKQSSLIVRPASSGWTVICSASAFSFFSFASASSSPS
jgi:hypothetical protein